MKNTRNYITTIFAAVTLIAGTPLFAESNATQVNISGYDQVVSEQDVAKYLELMNLTLLRFWYIDGTEDLIVDTVEGIRLRIFVKDGIIINSNEVPIE